MEPIRLILENFCGHQYSEIPFDQFSSALIIGTLNNNLKYSNGTGKSTIFSAIDYVLFNETKFSSLDKLIRDGTDFCRVSFEFLSFIDQTNYKIVRTRSAKSGTDVRLFKKNADLWQDLTQRRASDTEKELAKLIKLNYKTYTHSILFAQRDFIGLAALTPEKRKALLKEALQLTKYIKYETSAKKKVADLIKEIERNKILISALGQPANELIKLNKNIQELELMIENSTIEHHQLENNKEEAISQLQAQQKSLFAAETKIKEFKTKIESKQNLKSKLEQKTQQLTIQKKKNEILLQEGKKLDQLLQSQKESLDSLNNLFNLEKLNNTLQQIKTNQIKSIELQGSINSWINEKKKVNSPVPNQTICSTCFQIITEEHKHQHAKKISTKLLEIDSQITQSQNELKQLSTTNSELEQVSHDLQLYQDKIKTLEIEIKQNTNLISNKRNLYKEYNKIYQDLQQEVEVSIRELNDLKQDDFSLETLHLAYQKEQQNLTMLEQQIKNLTHTGNSVKDKINNAKNDLAVLLHKKSDMMNNLNEIQKMSEKNILLRKDLSIYQQIVLAFGSSGIPAMITHSILDDFQMEANNILNQIKPGLQIKFSILKTKENNEIDESALEILYLLNSIPREFAQLSGAQQVLVSLALKLGLAEILKKRIGIETNLLLLDEVDQSLDEACVETFADAVKVLQNKYKILVITHNNELKHKFASVIQVEQDNNAISKARLVN